MKRLMALFVSVKSILLSGVGRFLNILVVDGCFENLIKRGFYGQKNLFK